MTKIKKIIAGILGIGSFLLIGIIQRWKKTGKIGKVSSLILTIALFIFGLVNFYFVAPEKLTLAADTGFKDATATGDDHNQWTDPTDAYTDNANYAACETPNYLQDYYNFTFGVPSGATINGIEVFLNWSSGYNAGADTDVDLSWNGGTNYTSAKTAVSSGQFPTETDTTLGGATDTWGRSWSDTEFSNTNFRVRLKGTDVSGMTLVDYIKIKIYYTDAADDRRIIIID